MNKVGIKIDPRFRALIPPLSSDERALLEQNLKADGCREPLVLWGEILIDGHNRYEICERLGITYKTVEKEFESREAAEDWIDANQLGRRNLTPDQLSILRGRRYNRFKKLNGQRGPKKLDQVEPASTAETLAKQHGVSPATIKRDAKKAAFVESLPAVEWVPMEPATKLGGMDLPARRLYFNAAHPSLSEYRRERKTGELVWAFLAIFAFEFSNGDNGPQPDLFGKQFGDKSALEIIELLLATQISIGGVSEAKAAA